jgi:Type IV secretion system pilin
MQRLKYLISSSALFLLPVMASAQAPVQGGLATGAGGGQFETLLKSILTFTDNVLIPFIIGIGFLVFVWGMFKFFIVGGSNDDAKEQGKSLMIYATLGFVLIIVFWGIVNLLADSTGLENRGIDPLVPKTQTGIGSGASGGSGSGSI